MDNGSKVADASHTGKPHNSMTSQYDPTLYNEIDWQSLPSPRHASSNGRSLHNSELSDHLATLGYLSDWEHAVATDSEIST